MPYGTSTLNGGFGEVSVSGFTADRDRLARAASDGCMGDLGDKVVRTDSDGRTTKYVGGHQAGESFASRLAKGL